MYIHISTHVYTYVFSVELQRLLAMRALFMTHSHVFYSSFMRMTRLIHVRDMPRVYTHTYIYTHVFIRTDMLMYIHMYILMYIDTHTDILSHVSQVPMEFLHTFFIVYKNINVFR